MGWCSHVLPMEDETTNQGCLVQGQLINKPPSFRSPQSIEGNSPYGDSSLSYRLVTKNSSKLSLSLWLNWRIPLLAFTFFRAFTLAIIQGLPPVAPIPWRILWIFWNIYYLHLLGIYTDTETNTAEHDVQNEEFYLWSCGWGYSYWTVRDLL